MRHTVIQSFHPSPYHHSGEYPSPCVVEDVDGVRIFISPLGEDPEAIKDIALSSGCTMTVIEDVLGDGNRLVSIHHEEGPEWADEFSFPGYPSYREALSFYASQPTGGFVHLHTHSEFSSLDGLSTVKEIVEKAVADRQPAIAITDHGTCASHPHLQTECDKAGIQAIFGLEANFVDDRFRRPITAPKGSSKEELDMVKQDQSEVRDYWHLILWAQNDVGLRNLWAMSTEANREGFYYRPRMDWDTIEKYSEGVMCSTACLRGPVSSAILEGRDDLALARMARLKDIFGDRLYAEIHTNGLEQQKTVNETVVSLADSLSVPLIAVTDSHYSCPEHKDAHHVWIAAQTNKSLGDDSGLFEDDADYHIMTRSEVEQSLSYMNPSVVQTAMSNTVRLAQRCSARLSGDPTPPIYSVRGGVEADKETLIDLCLAHWEEKVVGKSRPQSEYVERFEYEMKMLISKDLCGYFDIVADYCQWSKRNGILVGPGRGSGGASLVAYLCGIIEIDPVDAELPFGRFLTQGRTELPDFDIDFPSERLPDVIAYVVDKWGEESVVRVGTHIKLKSKGVVRDVARTLKGMVEIDYTDLEAISKIIDNAERNTAGLGLSWEELWNLHGDELGPYRSLYPRLFELCDIMVGRLKSYGKHAAGLVIAAGENLTDRLPLRRGGDNDDELVAEFDKDALAALGLVKFDFLGLRNLDTLQRCVDLVKVRTGEVIDLYRWKSEYAEDNVWSFLSEGNTLGCFQIETTVGTRMTRYVQPKNLHDLADVITLDRPGPMRSGLDKLYLDRRFGRAPVTYADPRLKDVLHRTYGVMLYQEDIMGICQKLAGYDEEQADYVRSILGKKKVEAAKVEGRKIVSAAIERGMTQEAIEAIWTQMEEFSRYSFNKAHAYGYAVLAYWCAWLSYHYPVEFFTAAMSTVDAARIPEFVIGSKARKSPVLPPDINVSGLGFTADESVIRFGLDAIKGVGDKAAASIIEQQPYSSFEEFMERKPVNIGVTKLLVRAGCFDSLNPNRRQLEGFVAQHESGDIDRCIHWNPNATGAPNDLPCTFDWSSEPDRLGKSGKVLKPIPIPKKCNVRCRHFEKRTSLTPVDVEPYTSKEIRDIETELFGIFLSSSPFDVIPQQSLGEFFTASLLQATMDGCRLPAIAIVQKVRETTDKNGKKMGFADLFAQDGVIRTVCFQSQWRALHRNLTVGSMVIARIDKEGEAFILKDVQPLGREQQYVS
jgi:DNA polymerase-3 subunit alpha